MKVKRYELLVNLYSCEKDFSEKNILEYVKQVCRLIKMEKHGKLVLWRDSHNKIEFLRGGISAFQFIKTSNISIHTFEKSRQCFIDIFSCRKFDFDKAAGFSKRFFGAGRIKTRKIID